MTDLPILNWLILSVSLFNTIVLTWLGLTVWFAADRDRLARVENRRWGVWIISAGSLTGALFFISHTVLLGFSLDGRPGNSALWVRAAALPVVAIPFLWYAVILWYAGYGEAASTALRRRHQLPFRVLLVAAVLLAGWVLLPAALPDFEEILTLDFASFLQPVRGGVLVPVYLVFILACSGLSLDALLHPGETTRLMGEQARRRARPWLSATAALLVLAGLGLLAGYFYFAASPPDSRPFAPERAIDVLGWFDLALSLVITAGVVTLGRAVAAYEIFTGRSLPRRGLRAQWRRVLFLAAGYGGLVGGSLAIGARPVIVLLLTTMIMTVFFALLSWRSFHERERMIAQLRPFVSTRSGFDSLYAEAGEGEAGFRDAFDALCRTLLDARAAYLVPAGQMAQIVPQDLRSPQDLPPCPHSLLEDTAGGEEMVRMLAGADPPAWVVPLWGERGRTGFLVLEERRDGGLYTQEEIEIARTFCERLLGLRANLELTRRLLRLQRERLAESQVMDRRTRRVLHDEVLPKIHLAVLEAGRAGENEAQWQLTEVHREISGLLRGVLPGGRPDFSSVGVLQALRETLAREFAEDFDGTTWEGSPSAEEAFDGLGALEREVLFYAARECLRNAAQYGRAHTEERLEVVIRAEATPGLVQLAVRDNGRGLSGDKPSLGAGQGLALHRTLLEILGGELVVESEEGAFTEVRLAVPG